MNQKIPIPIDIEHIEIGENRNFIVKISVRKYPCVFSIERIDKKTFLIDKIPMEKETILKYMEIYEISQESANLLLQPEEELKIFLEKLK